MSRPEPFQLTSAAISLPSARKNSSLPSLRQTGSVPPLVDTCRFPPGPGKEVTYTCLVPDSSESYATKRPKPVFCEAPQHSSYKVAGPPGLRHVADLCIS